MRVSRFAARSMASRWCSVAGWNAARLALILVAGVLCVASASFAIRARAATHASANSSQQTAPDVPIEGLDPVLLVGGEERQGRLEIHADYGGFRYLFATEASRAAFLKDPARYSVQAGGACARMGPEHAFCMHGPSGPGIAHPEIWAVVDERIYLFWSQDCRTAFLASPTRYLEPAAPAPERTAATLRRAQALIDAAVAAAGGAGRLDALDSYVMTASQTIIAAGREFPGTATVHWLRPNRTREKLEGGPFTNIISATPEAGFVLAVFQGLGRFESELVRAQRERHIRRIQYHYTPLGVLLSRSVPGFQAVALEPAGTAPNALARVAVRFDDTALTLGIDGDGRIRSITFVDRGPDGEFGERLMTFDDFRDVDGVAIPHAVTGRFNGQADPGWTWTVTSVQLNPTIDPAIFETRR